MHNVHFSFSFIFSSLHPAFSPCGLQSSLQPARKKLQPARHRLQPARKRLQPFKKRRKSLQPARKKLQPVRMQFQPGGKNSAGGTQDGSGWIRMHIVHVSFSSCSYWFLRWRTKKLWCTLYTLVFFIIHSAHPSLHTLHTSQEETSSRLQLARKRLQPVMNRENQQSSSTV